MIILIIYELLYYYSYSISYAMLTHQDEDNNERFRIREANPTFIGVYYVRHVSVGKNVSGPKSSAYQDPYSRTSYDIS